MNNTVNLENFIPRTGRSFGLGIAIALGVLLVTILAGLMFVRELVHEQIAQRDAEAFYAAILMEQLDIAPSDGIEVRNDAQVGFDSAVLASRLRGVLGIRFFNANGVFSDTFPATIMPRPLEQDAVESIQELKPHSRFVSDTSLDSVFIYLPQFSAGRIAHIPTLQVTVPLHQRKSKKVVGAAQFIVEGQSIADEFARLDGRLIQIAGTTFLVSGALLVVMLWPAFRRVQKLNRNLAMHGRRLQRANDELALSARISAVGAISSHLMHGLKNPLASLSQFVSRSDPGETETEADPQEWQDALTASRRMQALVEHTLEVLCDDRGEPTYELTVTELGDDIQKRVAVMATRKKIMVSFLAEGNFALSSRTANLASLVLVNLLENAIEATPAGGTVSLSVSRKDERLCFRVRDEGSGFPDLQREHLFLPGKSSKDGGSGIGLAISKQIAEFLNAKLDLEKTSSQGCVFLLELPVSVCVELCG
jgi:signal transduction histidine kinase